MDKKIKNIALTGIFAAIICLVTGLPFLHIPTGINDGYLHFGDSMIYLAACVLPFPYPLFAAGIGGALADLLAGSAVWAPVTAIIKALNTIPFLLIFKWMKSEKDAFCILRPKTAVGSVVSGVITVFGYYIAEGLMYSFPSAWLSVPVSCLQAVGSTLIFVLFAAALDKAHFKMSLTTGR